MKRKKVRTRNPMAGILANPCFKKRVVRDKTKYIRKGGAAVKQLTDGSFSLCALTMEFERGFVGLDLLKESITLRSFTI